MRRVQFEHVIAAAAQVTGLEEFIVIGSQAILGSVTGDPPEELLESMEVDMYPKADPDRANEIDGVLGDGSWFEASHGYYAHGVGVLTAKVPVGWEERLVRVEIPPRVASTQKAVAYCLERHDLVLSKCVRGDKRDWDYARTAISSGLVDVAELRRRVPDLPVTPNQQAAIVRRLEGF
jgi:hypothetical protein